MSKLTSRSRRKPVAFISHSARSDVEPIRRALQHAGVRVKDSFGLPTGASVVEGTATEIRGADFVIAAIETDAANVFYEIGFASALGKPVLVIVAPGISIPTYVAQHRQVAADLTDSDILRLTLRGFLRELETGAAHKRSRVPPAHVSHRRDSAAIQHALDTIRELRSQGSEASLSRVTADMLRAAGVTAIEEFHGARERGADFALWSDALSATFGNPILVELKAGNLDETRWKNVHEQVADALAASGARAGLLLYLDRQGRRFTTLRPWAPVVLALDLEDFAQDLLSKPFAKVLLEHRNRLVHALP